MVLSVITSIAMKCSEEDVSVVLGIVGSVLGCFAAYILPGILRLAYLRKLQTKIRKFQAMPQDPLTREALKALQIKFKDGSSRVDVILNHLLVLVGVVFSVLGVWITISTAQNHAAH